MLSLIGTFVLVHGFSALLPPIPEEGERSYYEVLDVSPHASQDDIRRAYRKISLQLHPDKVAQRQRQQSDGDSSNTKHGTEHEIRQQYQLVQEAHGVLSNPQKRKRYDMLHQSPTQYQFVAGGMNPSSMYENLTHSSLCDKSRLVLLATVGCCVVLLQPILICAKVNQDIADSGGSLAETSWMLVLLPWWILYASIVVALAVVTVATRQVLFAIAFVEHLAWWIGQVLLALRWDATVVTVTWSYAIVFIPSYVALFFRWMHKVVRLQQLRHALQRMVTLDYLEQHVLQGRTYQDLTQDEIDELAQQYVIVHAPPTLATSNMSEEEKVQASPEFEHAVDAYTELMNALLVSIVCHTCFVALLVAKLDDGTLAHISWWVIFVPLWVQLGATILSSLYIVCCMTTVGEEIVVNHDDENDNDNGRTDETSSSPKEQEQHEQQHDGAATNSTEFKDRSVDDNLFADVEASIKDPAATSSSYKDQMVNDDLFADVEQASITSSPQPAAPSSDFVNNETISDDIDDAKDETKDDKTDESALQGGDAMTPVVPDLGAQQPHSQGQEEGGSQQDHVSSSTKEPKDEPAAKIDNDVIEEIPTTPIGGEQPGDIHIDEDMFREFESAYQEAEESAMEAQAKSQANCCSATFQLMMLCLVVGKLQQDYMRGENESPGYNAFWILFPIFLIFGCALCMCACLIYTAGESEEIDHLVERVSTTGKENAGSDGDEEDNNAAEATKTTTPSEDGGSGGAISASNGQSPHDTALDEPATGEVNNQSKGEMSEPVVVVAEIDDLD